MLSFLRTLFGTGRLVARPAKHQFRPQLSQLDDRIVPALNISASGGFLDIYGASGQERGTIEVYMGVEESIFLPGFGPIAVYQNGLRQPYTWDGQSISSIQVNGMAGVSNSWGSPDDRTDTVILNGVTVPGTVRVLLGGGNDRLTVQGRASAGQWHLDGDQGGDRVTFDRANVSGHVRVERTETVELVNAASGTTATSLASLFVAHHNHSTPVVSSVYLAPGTAVRGDLAVEAEVGYLDVAGRVLGGATLNATLPYSDWSLNNLSYANVLPGGEVTGNLTVGRSDLLAGRATASVEGRVNGNLSVFGSSAADVVLVNTGAVVGGSMTVRTAGGNDSVFVYGTVGANTGSQLTDLRTGDGNDRVEVGGSARVDTVSALLEGGDDTFVLYSGAGFASMLVGGGAGTDSFYGNRTQPNLAIGTFEVFG